MLVDIHLNNPIGVEHVEGEGGSSRESQTAGQWREVGKSVQEREDSFAGKSVGSWVEERR